MQQQEDGSDRGRCEYELHDRRSEYEPAHRTQPLRLDIEADQEQQQHDSNLPDSLHLIDIVGEQRVRGMGPKGRAHRQQGDDRAKGKALSDAASDNRHCDHHGDGQQDLIGIHQSLLREFRKGVDSLRWSNG